MPRAVQKATHVLVLSARLYQELAVSSLRLLQRRR